VVESGGLEKRFSQFRKQHKIQEILLPTNNLTSNPTSSSFPEIHRF
jgi:hypothetical protein